VFVTRYVYVTSSPILLSAVPDLSMLIDGRSTVSATEAVSLRSFGKLSGWKWTVTTFVSDGKSPG
jgi:hypothetical protein